jgi:hypothetical protein
MIEPNKVEYFFHLCGDFLTSSNVTLNEMIVMHHEGLYSAKNRVTDYWLLEYVRDGILLNNVQMYDEKPWQVGSDGIGCAEVQQRFMWVEDRMPFRSQIATYLHEYAHILQYENDRMPDPVRNPPSTYEASSIRRSSQEMTVETAAMLMCKLLGLEDSNTHMAYVSGHLYQKARWGDPSIPCNYVSDVLSLVQEITTNLNLYPKLVNKEV